MSHPNRVAPGSGGLPSTSGSSLLPGGLRSLEPNGLASEINIAILSHNTILSKLSYEEKLRTVQALLKYTNVGPGGFVILYLTSQMDDARRVYDGLDSNAKPKASLYAPSGADSSFNYGWFKELRQGLAISPASHALLALDRGLINLSRLSHLVVDDAHLVALEDASSPLSTILLDYYGKLPVPGRPRVLGLTHYPLELEPNFGYSALRMEQLLDARILGSLDSKRAEVTHNATRLEISVLEYEPPKATMSALPQFFHPAFEAAAVELGRWCVPLFSFFNPDSDSEGLIMGKRVAEMPLPEATSLDRTPKFNEVLKYLNAASESSTFRCIVIVSNPFTALALEWYLSMRQESKLRSALYLDHLKIDHKSGTREDFEEDFNDGVINTLICTESILSGIDGDVCSHIIWYNSPYPTVKAY
ncbi:hypothetical protein BN14_03357 [Rhizoctonia solani AG-1 IB]|uniref:Helicase C-terminal domain-containing protein n=1 Tax=Thanatephorus cucumeris (strain AG1-IB / isolate 7/3/14) TaxID=1108050 RepID=M5C0C9_THACB|nr:hypothetical protein BN14_03357 [Rhizoctonia solani AG-1 IB]